MAETKGSFLRSSNTRPPGPHCAISARGGPHGAGKGACTYRRPLAKSRGSGRPRPLGRGVVKVEIGSSAPGKIAAHPPGFGVRRSVLAVRPRAGPLAPLLVGSVWWEPAPKHDQHQGLWIIECYDAFKLCAAALPGAISADQSRRMGKLRVSSSDENRTRPCGASCRLNRPFAASGPRPDRAMPTTANSDADRGLPLSPYPVRCAATESLGVLHWERECPPGVPRSPFFRRLKYSRTLPLGSSGVVQPCDTDRNGNMARSKSYGPTGTRQVSRSSIGSGACVCQDGGQAMLAEGPGRSCADRTRRPAQDCRASPRPRQPPARHGRARRRRDGG